MKKTHVDEFGVVQGVIVLPDDWTGKIGEWPLPVGHILLNRVDCNPGDTWDAARERFISRVQSEDEKIAAYRRDVAVELGAPLGGDEIGALLKIMTVMADQQKASTPELSRKPDFRDAMNKLDAIRARHSR